MMDFQHTHLFNHSSQHITTPISPPRASESLRTYTIATMASQAATGSKSSSQWAARYRGATVEDLDPPAALSLNPSDAISLALLSAFERDYTHLTIVDGETRALLGYIAIPHLQAQLDAGKVQPQDPLSAAMTRFQRKGRKYRVITMQTPLEELESFFRGDESAERETPGGEWAQEFAVVTDENRRFVLGVATVQDLEEFVKRRPA
ncbi:hypothetical protein PWT90_10026 [Aphanocladium album]|nr:hypothetical protein PWT90_10026 [Aphanocladium album]